MSHCMQQPSLVLPAIISESTLLNFVAGASFETAVAAQFREHDADEDGCLSHSELFEALRSSLRLFDDYQVGYEERRRAANYSWPSINPAAAAEESNFEDDIDEAHKKEALFQLFDADGDGVVSAHEFATQMREILLGMAHGLRGCPLHMLLHSGSLLSHAVLYEQLAAASS